jgi:hypothetical protein
MNFQNFLDRLMAGDVRTFVVLGLLTLLVFVIYRYLKRILGPYQGYFKFMVVLLIALAVYTWVVDPERMGDIFNGIADWITQRIEPLFAGEDDRFPD